MINFILSQKKNKKKYFYCNFSLFFRVLLTFFLLFQNIFFTSIKSSNNSENFNSSKKKFVANSGNYLSGEDYIIDSGDSIIVKFKNLEIYTKEHFVSPEGNINLPDIGIYNVSQKIPSEIKNELELIYQKYIINPEISVSITKYRPISIYIKGEVKNPGLYKLQYSENESEFFTMPRLFEGLKKSRGLLNNADLSKIKIIRRNPDSKGGGKISATVDLLSMIIDGDQSVNVRLFDKDTIIVPKTENVIKDQLIAINRSNINPNEITVYITGNVISQGLFNVKKGTTLNQAIASSGGKKLFSGKIDFMRFNYDGQNERFTFAFDKDARANALNNPVLSDGDIINVRTTLFGKVKTTISEVGQPIITSYGIIKIFE